MDDNEAIVAQESGRTFFVAVHVGAGYHAPSNERAYRKAMRRACTAAAAVLSEGSGRSIDAVASAIQALEDDEITNAGRGSNLTEDGTVECDASIMDGLTGAFGAVGAAPGLRNPIMAANLLAKESQIPLPLGRIPPIFLVGDGARDWASRRGLCVGSRDAADGKWLTTQRSRRQWEKYTKMIQSLPASALAENKATPVLHDSSAKHSDVEEVKEMQGNDETAERDLVSDTVGAVCVDADGNVAAGASSGGIAMKVTGRVGLAALYGCGCWADAKLQSDAHSAGCSASGSGEHVIRALAARECCLATHRSENGPDACREFLLNLMNQPRVCRRGVDAGILLLQADSSLQGPAAHPRLKAVELVAAFTSESFGVGYYGNLMKTPKIYVQLDGNNVEELFYNHLNELLILKDKALV